MGELMLEDGAEDPGAWPDAIATFRMAVHWKRRGREMEPRNFSKYRFGIWIVRTEGELLQVLF
jgi:hypothetical protein